MKKDVMATRWNKVLNRKKEAPLFSKSSAMDERNSTNLTSQSITLASRP